MGRDSAEAAFEFLPSPDSPRGTGSGSAPWQVVHDVLEDRYRFVLNGANEMAVSQRNPAQAWVRGKRNTTVSWPGFEVLSEANGSLTSDEKTFTMTLAINVRANGSQFFQKNWCCSVPRVLL